MFGHFPKGSAVGLVSKKAYMSATAVVEEFLDVSCKPARAVQRMLEKVSRSLGSSSFPTRTGVQFFAGFSDSLGRGGVDGHDTQY